MPFRRLGDPLVGYNLNRFGHGLVREGFNWTQQATFEAGALTPNPTGFDAIVDGSNFLDVNASAALRGKLGLEVDLTNTVQKYGIFNGPDNEKILTFETLFDFSGIAMAASNKFAFLVSRGSGADANTFFVDIRYDGADYQIRQTVSNDLLVPKVGGLFVIDNTIAHILRHEWRASDGSDNGSLYMYLDGILLEKLPGIDNDGYDIDQIFIGVSVSGQPAGTSGMIYLDNIRWANRSI